MKFRDESNLTVKVITAETAYDLELELIKLDKMYDFIDLQYSTTGDYDHKEYSALALVRLKGN